MKKRILLVAFMLFFAIYALFSQQEIRITITPKTSFFPNTALSYVENPWKYFNVTISNLSPSPQQIYLTMSLTCQTSANGQSFNFETPDNKQPYAPITIQPGIPVILNQSHLNQMFSHLNINDIFPSEVNILDYMQLPEGQYNICLTPYIFQEQFNPANPQKAGESGCYSFNICYTGSAPEFVTPIIGQSAINPIRPTNKINPKTSNIPQKISSKQNTSIIRNLTRPTFQNSNAGFTVVAPSQQLIFRWTGVISNCLSQNNFDYHLKLVEVLPGQNVQDAIDRNATLITINNKSSLYYVYDTLKNRHFQLERGHIYAAQVQAKQKNLGSTEIQLGNDGKSQIIAFAWGQTNNSIGGPTNDENASIDPNVTTKEKNNKKDVLKEIRTPYLILPAQDNKAIAELTKRISSEKSNVPTEGKDIPYEEVEGTRIYKLPKSDKLNTQWMHLRSDSVTALDYTVKLFRYIGGDPNTSINSFTPLQTKTISITSPQEYALTNLTPYSFDNDWSKEMIEGEQYILQVKASYTYKYAKTTTYTTTEYIDGIPVTEDTSTTQILLAYDNATSSIVFQWGIDSSALVHINPAQFTYPTKTVESDSTWDEIPSYFKDSDFQFIWEAPKGVGYLGVSALDTVVYDLSIHELKDKQTIVKALKDTLFAQKDISEEHFKSQEMLDTLKIGKNYVAVLKTRIINNSDNYIIENKGFSKYAVFTLKDPEFEIVSVERNRICFPRTLDSVQTIISPKPDSLVKNNVQLKMGDFPLVMQTASKKGKYYQGTGYIVWKLFNIDCRIKVEFDSISINKDFEIINGFAVSAKQDSANYVQLNMGFGFTEWTDNQINKLVKMVGKNEQVKKYYDMVNKYAPYYDAISGLWNGNPAQTPVFTLPITIDDSKISNSENVKITIGEMYFSPFTSLMNILAIFNSNSDNLYIPLVATNVCMAQNGFLSNMDKGVDLCLGKNYEFDLSEGYKFRFKAGEKMGDTTNATYLSIDSSGFRKLAIVGEIDFGPELKYADLKQNGTVIPNKPVQARLVTTLNSSWKDWTATAYMDPFAITGIEDYTFIPTGKGIVIDHSTKTTPEFVKFPSGYDKKKSKEWKGFYMDQFMVLLPDDISNTFIDSEDETPKQDSVLVYNYGVNNSKVDSTHFYFDGSRIKIGAQNLILDTCGISIDLVATDLLKLRTDNGGGWAFSIDTVALRFVTNEFKFGRINGGIKIPLLTGDMKYDCILGIDSSTFALKPNTKEFGLELWAAKLAIDQPSSYFAINKKKDEDVKIDLVLNGKITIDFRKYDIPVDLPGLKFEKMTLKNYTTYEHPLDSDLVYLFDGLHFDAGKWSKASPQKRLGITYPEEYDHLSITELHALNTKGKVFSKTIGGFTMNLNSIKPIFKGKDENKYYTAGINFGGGISIGVGKSQSGKIGAEVGFEISTKVKIDGDFDLKDFTGHLDSINIETDLDVFKINGKLQFMREDTIMGNGLRGMLKVSILDKISLAMGGGFGTVERSKMNSTQYKESAKDEENNTFDWWYLEGVAQCKFGIQIGPVTINGFGGGFAYNMKPEFTLLNTNPKTLRNVNSNFFENMVGSNINRYFPYEDAWVAKAGISLYVGQPNAMNADGSISLRVANGHFSGFMLQVNAHVMTKYMQEQDTSLNTVLDIGALIAIENSKDRFDFLFSACAESEIDLTSLLKDAATEMVGAESIWPESGLLSEITVPTVVDTTRKVSGKLSFKIPIELSVCHYKKGNHPITNSPNAWYFCIGKPQEKERVEFSMEADMIVCTAKAKFTFYFLIGNYFPGGYELPPLTPEMTKFLSSVPNRGNLTGKAQAERQKSREKYLQMKNASGFAMGATFSATVDFNLFLHVQASTTLGFDVALLDVKGQSCTGHSQIGKNNFYAMGQIYAMIDGSIGLSLNLGFWKGEITLLKAGMGALLQGGGPNPTWCYGLLALRAEMLGGMIKINTSVDFELGEICVPGAEDPLANVKLFQEITPGYQSITQAKEKDNVVLPFSPMIISSNMPWNEEVVLCTQQDESGRAIDARKFIFKLYKEEITADHQYSIEEALSKGGSRHSRSSSPTNARSGSNWQTIPTSDLIVEQDRNVDNVLFIETSSGGFFPDNTHRVKLKAHAFEWRKREPKATNAKSDYMVNISTGKDIKTTTDNAYHWFHPTYTETDNGKDIIQIKPFTADTTVYFKTHPKPNNLHNQVLLTWPYNGEAFLPTNGLIDQDNIYIFINNDRSDIFDPSKLKASGRRMMIFYTETYIIAGLREESITLIEDKYIDYQYKDNIGEIKIQLPLGTYREKNGNLPKPEHNKMRKIELFLVDDNTYNSQLNEEIIKEQREKTSIQYETQGRNLLNIMGDNKSTQYSQGTKTKYPRGVEEPDVDLRQARIDVANREYLEKGQDTMMSFARKTTTIYNLATKIGNPIYTLRFRNYLPTDQVSNGGRNTSIYSDIFQAMKNENYDSYSTALQAKKKKDGQFNVLQHYAYIFANYTPNDPELYNSNVILPPIANFVLNKEASIKKGNKVLKAHNYYSNLLTEFFNTTRTVYKFDTYPTQKLSGCKGIGWNNNERSISMVHLTNSSLNWQKVDGGFTNLSYRITPSLSNDFTTYNRTPSQYYLTWSCPSILDISTSSNQLIRLTSDDDLKETISGFPYTACNHANYYFSDKTLRAIEDDVYKFWYFFQVLHNYGAAFHRWGYTDCKYKVSTATFITTRNSNRSKKEAHLNYTVSNPDLLLDMGIFPFQIPQLTRTLHYFYAWKFIFESPRTSVSLLYPQYKVQDNNYSTNQTKSNTNLAQYSHLLLYRVKELCGYDFPTYWFKYWIRSTHIPMIRDTEGIERALLTKSYVKNNVCFTNDYEGIYRYSSVYPIVVDIYYFDPSKSNAITTLRRVAKEIRNNTNSSENSRIFMTNNNYGLQSEWNWYETYSYGRKLDVNN